MHKDAICKFGEDYGELAVMHICPVFSQRIKNEKIFVTSVPSLRPLWLKQILNKTTYWKE